MHALYLTSVSVCQRSGAGIALVNVDQREGI